MTISYTIVETIQCKVWSKQQIKPHFVPQNHQTLEAIGYIES